MSGVGTGWIRGRFVGTYAGELSSERDGARRFSLELQSGAVHEARWVEAPADDGDGGADAATQHRKERLAHVRFALPGEPERVGALYDLRVEVTRLRHAHELGTRSFGRLEGTIVARTMPFEEAAEAEAVDALPAPQPPQTVPLDIAAATAPPTDRPAPALPDPTGAVPAVTPRVEPLRPFVQPIRRSSATPLEPVPRGFHPAWLLVLLVLGWLGVSAWLMCGPEAASTWATPLAAGALFRRTTLRLRLRFGEALGWLSIVLVCGLLALLVGPAEHAWRADCLPPLGIRLPVLGALVMTTVLLSRLGPVVIAALCWSLLTFGWCDQVDGTCGERAALARAERRWPKDPEKFAATVATTPLTEPPAPAAEPAPPESAPAPSEPAPIQPEAAPTQPEAAPTQPEREPPHPATPLSMEQANRTPARFFASKGQRSVVFPTQPIFGEQGAQVGQDGAIELSRLAALLKLQGKRRVRLELHTESRGDFAQEQALTSLQARAVRTWLERTGGVDTARLETVGLGSRRPLAALPLDSDLPASDRRMELHVLAPSPR